MLFRRRTTAFRPPQAGPAPRPFYIPSAEPVAIRFLDDPPPAPPPPPRPPSPPKAGPEPSPSPAGPPKKRRELPIGTLAFLAVVVGGLIIHQKARLLAPPETQADEVISRTFNVSEGEPPKVVVEVVNGDVEVGRGEPGVITCTVTRRSNGPDRDEAEADLRHLSVSMTQEGNTVHVSARRVAGSVRPGAGVSAKLRVPEGTAVRLKTTHSPIRVEGRRRAGSSRPARPTPRSRSRGASAASCWLLFQRPDQGRGGRRGRLRSTPRTARSTSAGRSAAGLLVLPHEQTAGSRSGLPADLAFKVDAKTTNGKISSEFGLSPSRSSKGRTLVGSVGDDPKVLLKVRSTNGGIRLQEEDN